MKVRKAVIPAAGWGTRFLPITKSVPKEILPLVDKPIIQYAVEECAACGIELIIIITSQGKAAIEDYFDKSVGLEHILEQRGKEDLLAKISHLSNLPSICFVHQKELLGLGHAVLAAKDVVGKEPFLVILPDDLFEQKELVLKKMLNIFEQYHGSVVAVKQVEPDEISRYGVVKPKRIAKDVYQIMDFIEKPEPSQAPSNLAIMGRYVLMPEVFEELQSTSFGIGGELQITDGLKRLLRRQAVFGYEIEGDYYDAGTILGWIKATIALGLKHPEIGPELKDYLNHLVH
ncbi:MAG: UTP--glucose-1-phosphate uridylyltransferase [Chloroflexi bacterium CG15_BIG_FIL_POST_REV_8_21_14_020_46_15]|nr:MAG: UTP--glucose-1-phosphate uridylyltransferase [Chloroflexi bacterium CG15_BIG_FIL_POST_REV_8_21_14_020_46_15]